MNASFNFREEVKGDDEFFVWSDSHEPKSFSDNTGLSPDGQTLKYVFGYNEHKLQLPKTRTLPTGDYILSRGYVGDHPSKSAPNAVPADETIILLLERKETDLYDKEQTIDRAVRMLKSGAMFVGFIIDTGWVESKTSIRPGVNPSVSQRRTMLNTRVNELMDVRVKDEHGRVRSLDFVKCVPPGVSCNNEIIVLMRRYMKFSLNIPLTEHVPAFLRKGAPQKSVTPYDTVQKTLTGFNGVGPTSAKKLHAGLGEGGLAQVLPLYLEENATHASVAKALGPGWGPSKAREIHYILFGSVGPEGFYEQAELLKAKHKSPNPKKKKPKTVIL